MNRKGEVVKSPFTPEELAITVTVPWAVLRDLLTDINIDDTSGYVRDAGDRPRVWLDSTNIDLEHLNLLRKAVDLEAEEVEVQP